MPADTFDRTGQAADHGSFAPLVAPEGMPHGSPINMPTKWLTQTGSSPKLGQTIVAYIPSPATIGDATPTVLLTVDNISKPVSGAERAFILNQEGVAPTSGVVVQRVRVRVREIANDGGDSAKWVITGALTPLNNAGESMPLRAYSKSRFGCTGSPTPLAGHGYQTNDTVQVCMYALGNIAGNPNLWLNNVQVGGVVDAQPAPVAVLTNSMQPVDTGE